jgi:hypothetical protein
MIWDAMVDVPSIRTKSLMNGEVACVSSDGLKGTILQEMLSYTFDLVFNMIIIDYSEY